MANELKVSKGLIVAGSGSVIASIQGSTGQLFSVTDSNTSGSVFTVKDPLSGFSILEMYPTSSANTGSATILSSSVYIRSPYTMPGLTIGGTSIYDPIGLAITPLT
jgi:hypothetical protein